jgi:hypothetical protein
MGLAKRSDARVIRTPSSHPSILPLDVDEITSQDADRMVFEQRKLCVKGVNACLRKIFLKAADKPDTGAAKSIDSLIRVTDNNLFLTFHS